MEDKKLRLMALKVTLGLQLKTINDWINANLVPRRFRKIEEEPFRPEAQPIVQVIEPDDELYTTYEREETNTTNGFFGYIPEEVRQQLLEGNTKVSRLFSDKRFLIAFKMENREYMVKAIELLYYDEIVDYDLLKVLLENKIVELTEEDVTYFKKIGLIPIQFGTGGGGSSLT